MHEALPPAVDGCSPPIDEVSDELEPFSDYDRVLLALAAVAAFLTIHRPVRPASPAAMAEFTSGHG